MKSVAKTKWIKRTIWGVAASVLLTITIIFGAGGLGSMIADILNVPHPSQWPITVFFVLFTLAGACGGATVRSIFMMNTPELMLSGMDEVQLEILAAFCEQERRTRENVVAKTVDKTVGKNEGATR